MQNAFCWQAPAGSIATLWQQVVHAQQPPPNPPNPPSSSWSATDGEITFAVIYPESEDAAVGIVAQVLVTQKPLPALRSVLLSVYDSDVDAERNPYTFAIHLPWFCRNASSLMMCYWPCSFSLIVRLAVCKTTAACGSVVSLSDNIRLSMFAQAMPSGWSLVEGSSSIYHIYLH